MKLRIKLPLITSIIVFLSIVLVSSFLIYKFKKETLENIDNFRNEEIIKVKQHIKDIVELSYEMIALSYRSPEDIELIEQIYGESIIEQSATLDKDVLLKNIRNDIMRVTLKDLRVLRYNNGEGYIWINTFNKPYKVIMHPTNPELEGKSLSDKKYNISSTGGNIYEAFAKLCREEGGGFIEYFYEKPGTNRKILKISYLKLFKEKNWVIGTGVYVDNIDKKVEIKSKDLNNKISKMVFMTSFVSFILITIAIIVLFRVSNSMTNAISKINKQLQEISMGKFPENLDLIRKDEIGEIKKSVDKLIYGFKNYTSFAKSIGKENFNAKFETLSKEDELGNSLLEMRNSLKISKQEDKKRTEEDKVRNWITTGQAKFSEILRHNTDNLKLLGDDIVYNLIKYLDANQGGLFVFKENEESKKLFIELLSSYAYDRKKYNSKKFEIGEGLIGTCAIEKESIYITNIPEEYIEITSGLGEATPRNLLLVPLKTENKIMGVIEIASFNKIKKHNIEFVEKIAENIASTLVIAKINSKTKYLLEKSKQTSEILVSQEEEMRQNIEELKATQEESARRENETIGILSAVDLVVARADISLDGKIVSLNDEMMFILEIEKKDKKIYNIKNFVPNKNLPQFKLDWKKVTEGRVIKGNIEIKTRKKNSVIITRAFSPVIRNDEVNKILFIAQKII